MAEEITLEQEVDRILRIGVPTTVPEEHVWDPEPFEDREFGSVLPEYPEGTEEDEETTVPTSVDLEDEEEEEED
jgi:hypothetical protein